MGIFFFLPVLLSGQKIIMGLKTLKCNLSTAQAQRISVSKCFLLAHDQTKYNNFFFFFFSSNRNHNLMNLIYYPEMAMEWGWRMEFSPLLRMVLFCPIPILPRLALHNGKIFLTAFLPLGAPKSPTPTLKTFLLVNLSRTITIFYSKTFFINKNILEITNKFILSNQTNFYQKLNNIIQVFNKTISQQQKDLIIQNQIFNSI